MKRKLYIILFTAILTLICIGGLVSCGDTSDDGGGGGNAEHNIVYRAAKDATCTEDGNYEYYECTDCG